MKLAFISTMNGIPWGGSEELWSRAALLAQKEGHQIFISVYNWESNVHPRLLELQKNGAILHLRERFKHDVSLPKKIKRFLFNRVQSLNTNWKSLERFNPDHILINQGGSYDMVSHHQDLRHCLRNGGYPYSILCHSNTKYSWMLSEQIYKEARKLFSDAHKVFVVSESMQQAIQRQIVKSLTNIRIVKNPVNISNTQLLPWPDDPVLQIALVGYLGNAKGQDIALEVLGNENWQSRNWKLNIYGHGYARDYLQELVSYYKLSDKVEFHGHVNDIKQVWRKNHILLISSAAEGLPLALVECMLCGRPAVVTDVGGNSELVQEGYSGFIAEAPSTNSIDNALERMWENKNNLEHMGQSAYSKIKNFYPNDPEKDFLIQLTQIY